MEETKNERFIRIATGRVTKVLVALDRLGNCAGPSYEYTGEQVEKMLDSLHSAIERLEEGFKARLEGKSEKEAFQF